jgi:uncharacterized sodium:solute symporter family permease YidK
MLPKFCHRCFPVGYVGCFGRVWFGHFHLPFNGVLNECEDVEYIGVYDDIGYHGGLAHVGPRRQIGIFVVRDVNKCFS